MGEAQKVEIAEAFKRRFEHFGFKKTTVDDVAKDLKISKKTIYAYFSTKEEIYYHIVYQVAVRLRDQMARDLEKCNTNREKLEKLIRMIFTQTRQWLKEGNDAFEFKYKYRISELAFKDAYSELVQTIVNDGIKNGEFSIATSNMMLQFIQGIMKESMDKITTEPDVKVEDETIAAIFKLLT
jgi:AcrR family transcriptional regulator